jgi:PKHD-type hydroxylase
MTEKIKKVAKKSPATQAREKRPTAGKIIADHTPTPNKKYIADPDLKTAQAVASNWWLDSVVNENWAFANNVFTAEECEKIIKIGTSGTHASPLTYGAVGDLNSVKKNIKEIAKIRRSPISWIRNDIPDNHWIYHRLQEVIKTINDQFFNFELTEIQSLQFTSYDAQEKGFYGKHIDMMHRGNGTRKLSLTIQLSDPSDYAGGDLLLHTAENPERPQRVQGTGIFFPGYTLHEVTPVTKGRRYSLVAWVLGPRFK